MPPLILVVDDEPVLRESVALLLADEGYRVACASDGREALEVESRSHPDLLVSDVHMPRMDGLEFVSRLRARDDALPVVLMSALHPAVDLPGVRFLAKPFDVDDLLAAIRDALADGAAP